MVGRLRRFFLLRHFGSGISRLFRYGELVRDFSLRLNELRGKQYDRVKTLTRVFIISAMVLSLVFYIPAELFPEKILSMFITTPGVAASGAANFRIMFSTYILQGSFIIAVTLFQSLGKANKATWLVLFRQIILFIPLCIVLPMVGGMGIRGVWLAIALTDAVLVVITVSMMLSEFRKMPETVKAK